MKTKVFRTIYGLAILVVVIILGFCPVQADTVWTSGHHEILNGDVYGEIWMYNDTTAGMWGGEVYQLTLFDSCEFTMFDGTMTWLRSGGNSIANLFGGDLDKLDIGESAILYLCAYDVQYHSTGGYWNGGWVDGYYFETDNYFAFDVRNEDVFVSYITIVPEPTTLILFGLGGLFLRKKT